MQHRVGRRPHRRKRASTRLISPEIHAAIPDNGVENFITPARDSAIEWRRRRRGREIVKRSALRLEVDLISLPPVKIPSTDIYYAQIVGEYCAKIDYFIIFILVESYNGVLKACVSIQKTGSNGWFDHSDSVQFPEVFINFFSEFLSERIHSLTRSLY